jgi:hypothetical protein
VIARRILTAAPLVLALVIAAPATAASASPGHNQATGSGTLGQFGDPTASVNAVQTSAGLIGGFTISYPDQTFATGTATCLSVLGGTAYVTGKITDSGGPRQQGNNWLVGNYLIVGIQDNGQPGTAGPDQLNFSPGFSADPGCGPNLAADPVFSVVTGNYRVFSAP